MNMLKSGEKKYLILPEKSFALRELYVHIQNIERLLPFFPDSLILG